MAKLRSVNTGFWDDEYVGELSRDEQHLFLYLLTNPLTNMAGAYKIARKVIRTHTGFSDTEFDTVMSKFETDGKAIYREGWIVLTNWLKNQSLNDNMKKGVIACITDVPAWVTLRVLGFIKGSQSLSKAFEGFHTELETLSAGVETLWKDEKEKEGKVEGESELEKTPLPKNQSSDLSHCSSLALNVFLGEVEAGLSKRMSITNLPDQRDWHQRLTWAFNNNFSVASVLECYDLLKTDEFWKSKSISAKTLTANLTNLVTMRQAVQVNGGGKPKGLTGRQFAAEVERQEREIQI